MLLIYFHSLIGHECIGCAKQYCAILTIMSLGYDIPWLLNFNNTEGVRTVALRFLATHVTPRRRREDFVTLCNRGKLGFLTTIGLCDP